jgi:CDGSH-type Zn-finger protein
MSDVTIRIRDNGPLLVEGAVRLIDAQGNAFTLPADKPAIAFCRCGHSANKPFCDGSHRTSGFQSVCQAVKPQAQGCKLHFVNQSGVASPPFCTLAGR